MNPLFFLSVGVCLIAVAGAVSLWVRYRDGKLMLYSCSLLAIIAGQASLTFSVAQVVGEVDRFWSEAWTAATLLVSLFAMFTVYLLHHIAAERFRSITERRSAEQTLRESNQRFRIMADAAPVLIWITDHAGHSVYFNKPWLDFRGRPMADECRDGWQSALHADDLGRPLAACREAVAARRAFASELRLRRHDGEHRWMLTNAIPMFLTDGVFAGYIATCVDITERKRDEERQRLMMTELDHRVKNSLTSVLSLAEQTLRSASSLGEFREAFLGRLHAMAHTHEALAHNKWEGIRLDEAARVTLNAFRQQDPARLEIEGEPIILPARAALPISLTLHELATNAVKYGALSNPSGRVELRWKRVEGSVHVSWVESGGPSVKTPTAEGMGSKLIQGLIRFELGGEVEMDYQTDGFRCRIRLPITEPTPHPTPPDHR